MKTKKTDLWELSIPNLMNEIHKKNVEATFCDVCTKKMSKFCKKFCTKCNERYYKK